MSTLELLETDKDVFNYVKNHLLNQNWKCQDEDGLECLYKGQFDDGLMCAVGCLISDTYYHPGLEQRNVGNAAILEALNNSMPKWKLNLKLLSQLQTIHDRFPVEEWEDQLNEMSDAYNEEQEV